MNIKYLRADILGGITAAVVALPLALAFGVQSNMGAQAGLYGAIALGFFASLFGGTKSQISGPTAPMTVISAMLVATLINEVGSLAQALPYILITFLLAGFLQILFGVLKFGKSVRYIPYPVVSGFMTGIGIIVILMQVFPLLGHDSPSKLFDVFLVLHEPLSDINPYTCALTLSTIMVIYLFPRVTRVIPSPLIALVLLTLSSSYFNFPVPTIGSIPDSFPSFAFKTFMQFDFHHWNLIISTGFTLAALGSIDSLLTSVIADNMTQTKHNSDRELIGQGFGNMVAACFAGIPGAGATVRTAVNINAGGRTCLSGMTHSIVLLIVLLGSGSFVSQIPQAVLAGILITVGISIIDYRGLRHLRDITRTDAFIMIAVILLTVFVDLLQAVAAGMVLATFFFMKQCSQIAEEKMVIAPLHDFAKELPWDDDVLLPEALQKEVYIKHIEGPLFFGFISQFKNLIESIPEVKHVIFRMKNVPYIDQSGLYALEDSIMYLQSKNVNVMLTALQSQPLDMLKGIGVIPRLVEEDNIYPSFIACVKALSTMEHHTVAQSTTADDTKVDGSTYRT